jgi:hypothetical protein
MQKLLVSFSGGLTSGYMMRRLMLDYAAQYEMVFVFANTGQENEKTLRFVDRCDRDWNASVVWIEAVTYHDERKSSGHRIVDFTTASRNGEPFEQVIKKYGIPNKPFPHCTRELKRNAINSFRNSIGWADCLSAIGIRADEPKRVKPSAEKEGIVYPLAHWFPTNKAMVNDWWEDQPFSLGLKSYEGNCMWCWKKSGSKLIRIATETPEVFEFPSRMEEQYAMAGPSGQPQVFFRGHQSAKDILATANLVHPGLLFEDPDEDAGCGESCEAF